MPIAPHEGRELEFVVNGIKPLASIDKKKQPEQFARALTLQHCMSIQHHADDLITVTLTENKELHDVFRILSTTKSSIIVKTSTEKHMLLGRLFGYSEEDIQEFLKAEMTCACGQCDWDKPKDS